MSLAKQKAQKILEELRALAGKEPKLELKGEENSTEVHLSTKGWTLPPKDFSKLVDITAGQQVTFRRSGPNCKMIIS